MNNGYDTAEQRIREYQSRLKHFDERLAAEAALNQRRPLTGATGISPDWEVHRIKNSGPMGIWDAVAQDIEHALQRWKL